MVGLYRVAWTTEKLKPQSTSYRLIADYDYYADAIDKLWAETSIPKFPTVYPQIVAERDGKVVGFIARRHVKDNVVVEPVLAPNIFVYIRLIENLERVLKQAGVGFYYFRLEPQRVKHERLLRKGGEAFVKDLGYHDGYLWFRRSIGENLHENSLGS